MTKADSAPLTVAQREIMEVVWERGEVTVSEVLEVLARRREVARNTVQTMITRLEEKGWLKHRELGRAFIYSAARSETTSLGAKVVQMVDRFFSGSPEEMVTALIEYRGLSEEEGRRIRKMIEQAEGDAQPRANQPKRSARSSSKGDKS